MQRLGPTTVVLDLSEAFAGAAKYANDDPAVLKTIEGIRGYADTSSIVDLTLLKIAKLETFLRQWRVDNDIDAFGIQCWTSIQENYGSCSCTVMSRFGDEGVPCACEADILGTMSMHACMLASGNPAGLADWNNLHNEDDELANIWHCGVFPAAFAKTQPKLGVQEIIASGADVNREDAMGVVEFVAKEAPLTLSRVTQDDGKLKIMFAEGAFEDNPAVTFGGYGWARIPNLIPLYRDILLRHFPHHVAMTHDHVGNVLYEAFGNYLGAEVYFANQSTPGLYTPDRPF